MNLVLGFLVVIVTTAITVTAMLLVRRRAPEGSWFKDGDRASGVFGVLATGFSVLLGFIIFLAFTSYDDSRSGAEAEALAITQQFETAQFFPREAAGQLSGQIQCYARSVVHQEWPEMRKGEQRDVNPWGIALFRTIKSSNPQTNAEQSAYDKFNDLTSDREEARRDRIHGAAGVIPAPLWVVLFFISLIIFGYMLFFADSDEGPFTQAMLMGSVTAVITVMLLLLVFLDSPFRSGVGSLKPSAMARAVKNMDAAARAAGLAVRAPCDANGRAV